MEFLGQSLCFWSNQSSQETGLCLWLGVMRQPSREGFGTWGQREQQVHFLNDFSGQSSPSFSSVRFLSIEQQPRYHGLPTALDSRVDQSGTSRMNWNSRANSPGDEQIFPYHWVLSTAVHSRKNLLNPWLVSTKNQSWVSPPGMVLELQVSTDMTWEPLSSRWDKKSVKSQADGMPSKHTEKVQISWLTKAGILGRGIGWRAAQKILCMSNYKIN